MSAPAYTFRKPSGTYYFQIKIPVDLIGKADPSSSKPLPKLIRKSLSTHSRKEATRKATRLANQYLSVFDELRKASKPVVEVVGKPELIEPIGMYGFQGATALIEHNVRELIEEAESYDPRQPLEGRGLLLDAVVSNPSCVMPEGFSAEELTPEVVRAVALKTFAETLVTRRKALHNWKPPVSIRKPLGMLMDSLVEQRKPDEIREKAYRAAVRQYERDYLKRTAYVPADLSEQALRAYREQYLKSRKIATWNNNQANVFNLLVKLACEQGLIDREFSVSVSASEMKAFRRAQGLPQHDDSEEVRRASTQEELSLLYSLPVVQEYIDYVEFVRLTGMRTTEAGQLMGRDLIRDPEYGLFVRVSDSEGRRVKNRSSVRTVPVPDRFAVMFEQAEEDSYLLPLPPTSQPQRTKAFTQLFSRQKQKAGLPEQVTFHSLRHDWKAAARLAGVREDVDDYLTGHSQKGRKVQMGYGQGYDNSYKILREAQEKVIVALVGIFPPQNRPL